jgi:metal-dependent amidase/aminoacylase/carboxypeptidase family protein
VLTVGTIRGGERFNILPSSVTLTGTVRTLSEKTHARMPGWIRRTAEGRRARPGRAGGIEVRSARTRGHQRPRHGGPGPPRRRRNGGRGARRRPGRSPPWGARIFRSTLHRAPGCFVYVGTGADARTRRPWHHAEFALHEPSMLNGVKFYMAVARRALRELAN